jgi:hypothetical protein
MPDTHPDNAMEIPAATGGPFGQTPQIQAYNQVQSMVDASNTNALAAYNGQCATWLTNAQIYRNLGLSSPPPPQQPVSTVLNSDPAPPVFGQDIWVWEMPGPLLGSPCPSLPPIPVPVPNTVAIGGPVGGPWFQALPEDTMPDKSIVVVTGGPLYPTGTYEKWDTPWGNLYLKLK